VLPIAVTPRTERQPLRRVVDELKRQGLKTQIGARWTEISVQPLFQRVQTET